MWLVKAFQFLHKRLLGKCLNNHICLMHNIMDSKHEKSCSFTNLHCHITLNRCKNNNTIKPIINQLVINIFHY